MSEKIQLLIKGDKIAFREIFNQYFQPLCHLGFHYLEDKSEAKGVVQDAYVKLWEIRHTLNPDSNLQNFLFTLVKNNCLNILKRKQIQLKHHEKIREIELLYQHESLSRINDDYLEFNELKKKIDIAIEKLPEHCRIVFKMSRYEEMKNREIAEKLGITQKAVEARMTKALKYLRNELKDFLPLIAVITSLLD
uniref:RNA polymerase sigma-70 factor n=1 Tax=uncultured Draconibacterium sp. TaxID=1573823 RepID=UPI003217D49F